MKISLMSAAAAVALVAGAASAQAACGVPMGTHLTQVKLPPLHYVKTPSGNSIVGTWIDTLIVGGNPAFNTLIQWHSDGTESDNADIPPTGGNVCAGSWMSTGRRTVHRYHLGWTFDTSSNPSGMFVLTEDDKLARDGNSYNGSFDQKFYDVNGNLVNEISGDVAAKRVSAN